MASFLWVEDFDGPDVSTTTTGVFGRLAGDVNNIPDNKYKLRDYLADRSIYLETNLTDALRLVNDKERLDKIDYVVLDIDLDIFDDPDDENQDLLADVLDWYHELPTRREQRMELKKVAGYHLWTRLVIDRGFPRDRIQFCSNHGDYLNSIKKSFGEARIVAPEIFRKGDGRTSEWIRRRASDPYTSLRRKVIDYCEMVASHLRSLSDDCPQMLRLAQLPGKTTRDFKRHNALEMLQILPHHLPPFVPEENWPEILRGFARAMTMDWDRFSAEAAELKGFENRSRIEYKKAIKSHFRCGASVLKLLRNTLSHASEKQISLDCVDTAILFVLNMNVMFCLDDIDDRNLADGDLLPNNSGGSTPEPEKLRSLIQRSKSSVTELALQSGIKTEWNEGQQRGVGELLRDLQKGSSREYQCDAVKWVFRMLWHELTWNREDMRTFANQFQNIHRSPDPIHKVAMACLGKAF